MSRLLWAGFPTNTTFLLFLFACFYLPHPADRALWILPCSGSFLLKRGDISPWVNTQATQWLLHCNLPRVAWHVMLCAEVNQCFPLPAGVSLLSCNTSWHLSFQKKSLETPLLAERLCTMCSGSSSTTRMKKNLGLCSFSQVPWKCTQCINQILQNELL